MEDVDPLSEAGERHDTIHNYARKLAEAAGQHPEIPYELSQTPYLNNETEIIGRDESELNADIATYTALISRELQDTDELFYFELEREVDSYVRQNNEASFEETWQAHDELQKSYDYLKDSIKSIDSKLDRHPAAHLMTGSEKPKLLEPVNSTLQPASD